MRVACIAILLHLVAASTVIGQGPSKYVNPFIGTGGHGHTFPGPTAPFGMVQLGPDTRLEGWDGCSGYHHTDHVIYGFSHTHLSGTGVGDYGDVLLMPAQGEVRFNNGAKKGVEHGYASSFQKENERAGAGHYEVKLDAHDIDVRLTTTNRVGIHEYSFNRDFPSHIILDLEHRDALIDFEIEAVTDRSIKGRRISKAWAQEQHIYFYIEFSEPIKNHSFSEAQSKMVVHFNDLGAKPLMVKVGISAVDTEGAQKNLETETPHWDFDLYQQQAIQAWDNALSKIEIEDTSDDKKRIFYTALYHSMIAPNTFSDSDGRYRGMDQKIHQADHTVYTVFSLWDTFRATHPLYSIIEQDRTNAFIKTFLKQYRDGGILPIWELAGNYTGCMIGYHAIPVIADAYVKGIRGYDATLALEAMLHSGSQDHLGMSAYKRRGYIGMGDESESVSKTLEYAYDDWCIATMAKALGHDSYDIYMNRAQNYKNLFNPEVGFMQSKTNGGWSHGFDPAEVNFNFTEANSWQYSMFAPHDISGLVSIYGGPDAFESKLDQLFDTQMELSGRHQADITGLIGQYAHGNEPSHHMAYLYNYIGKAHKTQQRVHQILEEQYSNRPDGLAGNEDCGQMSSWYVLSAMGFYSVTPGLDYYTIGTPHIEKSTIHLENGNEFTIEARNLSTTNYYIQSATLNGKSYDQSYVNHADMMAGGALVFEMGPSPSAWGSQSPVSSIDQSTTIPVPYFQSEGQTFSDSLTVALVSLDSECEIYYRMNGGSETLYQEPITLTEDATFEAYATKLNARSPTVSDVYYKKIRGGRSITLESEYSNQYSGGGDAALIDYLKGSNNFRTGYWQGYYATDFGAVIDLGSTQTIHNVSVGALQDIKSWIWYPKEVRISFSQDGEHYSVLGKQPNNFPEDEYGAFIQQFAFPIPIGINARYIKVEATSFGKCPDWHLGNGNDTWMFLDEISIE